MKFKRRLWPLGLVPVVALVWAMRSAASWRPQLVGVQRNASSPVVSSDGRYLVAETTDNVNGFQLWDVAAQRSLWKKSNHHSWMSMALDTKRLLVVRANYPLAFEISNFSGMTFEICDLRSGQLLRSLQKLPTPERYASAALLFFGFSFDGREVVMMRASSLYRWSAASGRLLFTHKWADASPHTAAYCSASFIAEKNQIVASECVSGKIVMLDARTGKKLRDMKKLSASASNSMGNFLQVSPDGFSFYELRDDTSTSRIFRLSDGKQLWSSSEWPTFSSDGKLTYVPNQKGLDIVDARTGRKLQTIPGPTEYGFELSPDGNWLYEARGGKIWKWRAR